MKNKGQLTVMILTGIVLLFAVGLVIWLGTKTAERKIAPEAEQQRLRQVAVQPVKDYIQSCLDITTSTALELLGKQGGVLYESQGGLTPDFVVQDEGSKYVVFDELKVRYAILPPAGDVGQLFFSQPPKYPFRTFPYVFKNDDENTEMIIQSQEVGYFGVPQFPPLLKPGRESIQEQLESSIAFSLPKCAKWETFEAQGLAVSVSELPNVSVYVAENITQIATEQFFTVFVEWPVAVQDRTTGGETVLRQFSLGYPVHLAQFYLFVKGLVDREVSEVRFDPRTASAPATPVVVVEGVFTNPGDNGQDDVIIAQDAQSFLRGKPLEFRLLRRNRAPAMVWVNQTDLDDYKFIPTGTCNLDAENIYLQADKLDVKWGDPSDWSAKLAALDPDEDLAVFKTYPPAPAKIDVLYAGQEFNLDVCAGDGSTVEDCQRLKLKTEDCPTP